MTTIEGWKLFVFKKADWFMYGLSEFRSTVDPETPKLPTLKSVPNMDWRFFGYAPCVMLSPTQATRTELAWTVSIRLPKNKATMPTNEMKITVPTANNFFLVVVIFFTHRCGQAFLPWDESASILRWLKNRRILRRASNLFSKVDHCSRVVIRCKKERNGEQGLLGWRVKPIRTQ